MVLNHPCRPLLPRAACTGDLSRNRTVGLRLGKGEKLEDITATMGVRRGGGVEG